jgi:alpha-galactosidase
MFHSPLIIGGNLLLCDEWTKSLVTNAEVIAVDQHSKSNHAVETAKSSAVWIAEQESAGNFYVAVFNRSDEPQTLRYTWKELGLKGSDYALRDLWEHKELGHAGSMEVTLAAHASVLYALRPAAKR